MFSLSNVLSFLRAPLALLFFSESTSLRMAAIILAMITDSIDGYVARRSRSVTQFGAILDPAMDKLFVFTALGVFFVEQRLELWQALTMLSRDFALCLFGLYIALSGQWHTYQFKAIRWGKISTALQFIVLSFLALKIAVPPFIFGVFVIFGLLAFTELLQFKKQASIVN